MKNLFSFGYRYEDGYFVRPGQSFSLTGGLSVRHPAYLCNVAESCFCPNDRPCRYVLNKKRLPRSKLYFIN